MNMAFVDINPFPLRQIKNRRTFHLEKVRLELTELEAIRQTFLRERETSQDGRTLISDDEEDNWIPASQQQHAHLCETMMYLWSPPSEIVVSSLDCIAVHMKQPFKFSSIFPSFSRVVSAGWCFDIMFVVFLFFFFYLQIAMNKPHVDKWVSIYWAKV